MYCVGILRGFQRLCLRCCREIGAKRKRDAAEKASKDEDDRKTAKERWEQPLRRCPLPAPSVASQQWTIALDMRFVVVAVVVHIYILRIFFFLVAVLALVLVYYCCFLGHCHVAKASLYTIDANPSRLRRRRILFLSATSVASTSSLERSGAGESVPVRCFTGKKLTLFHRRSGLRVHAWHHHLTSSHVD